MLTSEADFGGALAIDSYGPGFFRVAGSVRRGGLLIRAEAAAPWHGLTDIVPLTELAGLIDVVLVGMGDEVAYLPKPLIAALDPLGIMCEPMTTPSAARTYNVLVAEGRRVAAALIPVTKG